MELVSSADVLIGQQGSHTTRNMYYGIVGRTGYIPPFISVDGSSGCCEVSSWEFEPLPLWGVRSVDGRRGHANECLRVKPAVDFPSFSKVFCRLDLNSLSFS